MFVVDTYVAIKISNLPHNEQIREARKRKNMMQKELADKIGVCSSYVCKLEKGIEVPSIELAKKLTNSLKPYINKRTFLKKILLNKGIKEEDLFPFKKFLTMFKK
jgi:DNA-binding XRE family transcriptional regulator